MSRHHPRCATHLDHARCSCERESQIDVNKAVVFKSEWVGADDTMAGPVWIVTTRERVSYREGQWVALSTARDLARALGVELQTS